VTARLSFDSSRAHRHLPTSENTACRKPLPAAIMKGRIVLLLSGRRWKEALPRNHFTPR
jgi:hypothetical protein